MEVRLAVPADAEAIRVIYNHEVVSSVATFDLVERSREAQVEWLAERSGAFSVLLAEVDGEGAGFCLLDPSDASDETPCLNSGGLLSGI